MIQIVDALLFIFMGYLIGSISFSIIVTRLIKGVDIRELGSGNAGMTNVLRNIGKGPAILVLIGDTLKGIISVLIAFHYSNEAVAVMCGLATMAGHTYPLYFRFKGGKGVATGLGVTIALAPDITLIAIGIFIITVLISRYVSLGSILGALSVPINMIIFEKHLAIILFGVIGSIFVLYRHKANIVRLYKKEEYKIGQKQ